MRVLAARPRSCYLGASGGLNARGELELSEVRSAAAHRTATDTGDLRLFARLSHVSLETATSATDALVFPEIMQLLRRAPLGRGAVLQALIVFGVLRLGVWFGIERVQSGGVTYVVLLMLVGLLLLGYVYWNAPNVVATVIYRRGRETRARVIQRAVAHRKEVYED